MESCEIVVCLDPGMAVSHLGLVLENSGRSYLAEDNRSSDVVDIGTGSHLFLDHSVDMMVFLVGY